MSQEVSLETFRDLLTAEISLQRKGKDLKRDLFAGLSASGMITDRELQELLAIHRPPFSQMIETLKEDNVIDGEAARRLIAEYREDEADAYESPVIDRTITAEAVCQSLGHPDSRQMRRAALYLALQLFCCNGLLEEAELEQMVHELHGHALKEVSERLRRNVDLSITGLKAFLDRDLRVPSVELEGVEIDPALFGLFPQSLIRRQIFVPFRQDKESIGVALVDPFNVTLVALLEWATGRWPCPAFALASRIIAKINGFYGPMQVYGQPPRARDEFEERREAASAAVETARPAVAPVARTGVSLQAKAGTERSKEVSGAKAVADAQAVRLESTLLADNLSAVQLVSSLIESAIDLRTTDIHIEPTRTGLTVRFRIDGDLHRIMSVPPAMSQTVISRVKVLADMDVTERRRPQDGHFELNLVDHNYDFRISTLPSILGEKVAIRILDSSRVMTGLDHLGLLKGQREDFEWMLDRPYGMILVTGPTGSGKTSTLYSGLQRLNSEKRNVVTIEDPVEYQLGGISQVQVDPNIDLTFAQGLRSILRQDPDVIMIGEIRDGTTAQIAIRAAMTGHVVLSTLHTNNALGAFDALVNLGTVRFMLAGSVVGIISQRLLRVLCERCKRPDKLTAELRAEFNIQANARKGIRKSVGCNECLGTGYLGRTGVFEVIRITEPLRPLIVEHHPEELERAVRKAGVLSLQEAAVQKVLDGVTSVDEVRRKIILEI
jgi:type II secretory ATPase GspE/PulE/Tfp pilus assembly ATPase PilB-like protein